jgi:hypothetical protein
VVVSVFDAGLLFEELALDQEEAERVEPWSENARNNFSNTSFSESKVVTSYDR